MRRAALMWIASLAACVVSLDDHPGRACDETHPCQSWRNCVDGFCASDFELDAGGHGGSGGAGGLGGTGGAGGGSAGGGTANADAGQVVWTQAGYGFLASSVCPTCTLTISPALGSLLSMVTSAADTDDFAWAEQTDPQRMPRRPDGRFRGHLQLAAPVRLSGLASFATLGSLAGAKWLDLGFDEQGRLRVASDPGTVTTAAVTQLISRDGGFGPGDHIIDVAWRRGGTRRVFVDDVLMDETAVGLGGASTLPERLSLGISHYDGDAGTGWSVTLSQFALSDDPSITLGGPP